MKYNNDTFKKFCKDEKIELLCEDKKIDRTSKIQGTCQSTDCYKKFSKGFRALFENKIFLCDSCKNVKFPRLKTKDSLDLTHPHLVDEWITKLNGNIKDYTKGSDKPAWFQCKKQECHKYEIPISSRTRKNESCCGYCVNQLVCPCEFCKQSLYYTNPELRDEWDGCCEDMKLVVSGSDKHQKFKCVKNPICHKWTSRINDRTGNFRQGCPYCSIPTKKICPCEKCPNLYNNNPNLRIEWVGDPEEMKFLSSGSGEKRKWKCVDCNYEWVVSINNRAGVNKTGCPSCSGSRSEKEVRKIFEDHYKKSFHKYRPKFLKGLELDGYNDELCTAFEYQGIQHEKFHPRFFHKHGGIDSFNAQLERDKQKKLLCLENNIKLIIIPSKYTFKNLKELKEYILCQINYIKF